METLHEFLSDLKRRGLDQGQLPGLFHILIGRRITRTDGSVVCTGLTWRELANWLKKVRWDPEAVRELGLEPDDLPPRDRQQYWYTAIARAQVYSESASRAADQLAEKLKKLGYIVGPAPGRK